MSRASGTCSRAWEIGAWRDGRLRSSDVESLRRHLPACASCADEHARLEALGEALCSLPPVPDDALAARRLRHRLLSDVNQWMVSPPPARRGTWRLAAAGALVAGLLSVSLLGYRTWRSTTAQSAGRQATAAVSATPSPAPPLEITATDGARFRKQEVGKDLVLDLLDGEVALTIGAHQKTQQVRIQLPDGWIEDLGTILSVRVENGHTLSVQVRQGRVRLHLAQREPIELSAGEGWSAPRPVASVARPSPASAVSAARRRLAAPAAPLPNASAPVDSTADARAAREEDEAYLHIVALLRAHQADEARAAAKQYLARFPNGFRREEVAGVAGK